MKLRKHMAVLIAGAAAGAVNGLFGAGGGMVLVPLLRMDQNLDENSIFPSSVAIILPVCLVSLVCTAFSSSLPFSASVPYLIGSTAGGFLAGRYGGKIPTLWLHRGLGAMILWGGVRYLC